MEQLSRLKARIASLGELRDIMGAMRVLAASHVQEAQGALVGIRRYVQVIEDAIAEGAALLAETGGRPAEVPATPGALVVLCSEHGFAGAFNDRLLDRAEAELAPGRRLGVVGRRGALLAAERGLQVAWSAPMATHVGGVPACTRRIAAELHDATAAALVFGVYRRGGAYEVEARPVLPLDPALLAGSERRIRPVHTLAPGVLLRRLAGEYLFAEITRAVMESLASENGARLRVMEAADRNIGDRLDALRLREHVLRQEAVTEELLDVVTGAEAIMGPPA